MSTFPQAHQQPPADDGWLYVSPRSTPQVQEQWLRRHAAQSLASVRAGEKPMEWVATLLTLKNNAAVIHLRAESLGDAQLETERALRALGWKI